MSRAWIALALSALAAPHLSAQCRVSPGGCGSSNIGTPVIGCRGNPNINCSGFTVTAGGLPVTRSVGCVVFLGLPGGSLPLPPPTGCSPGCALGMGFLIGASSFQPNALGVHAIRLPIPNNPALVSATLAVQVGCVLSQPTTQPCLIMSPTLHFRISQGPCF